MAYRSDLGEIVLVDARCDSLTISWPPIPEATFYLLEYRTTIDNEFELLADDLTLTEIRKGAVDCRNEYVFRVAAIYEDETISPWMSHPEPFRPLTIEEDEDFSMAPPVVRRLKKPQTLLVEWEDINEEIYGFELQMRQNRGGRGWQTIATDLQRPVVKKKNLKCKWGYQFRVRPVTDQGDKEPFSPPSKAVIAKGATPMFAPILLKGLSGNGQQQQQASSHRGRNQKQRQQPYEEEYDEEEYYYNGEDEEDDDEGPFVMDAPWFRNAEEANALIVCWHPVEYATGYELQMIKCMKKRAKWETIAPNLKGTQVKKKNLTSKGGYQFRVRANGFEEAMEFSPPSNTAIAN